MGHRVQEASLASQDQLVLLVQWDHKVLLVHKVFKVLLVQWEHKVQRAAQEMTDQPDQLALSVQLALTV